MVGLTLIPTIGFLQLEMERQQSPEQHAERTAWLAQHAPAANALEELSEAGVVLSDSLVEVLRACLQVVPGERVQSAGALLEFPFFQNAAPKT